MKSMNSSIIRDSRNFNQEEQCLSLVTNGENELGLSLLCGAHSITHQNRPILFYSHFCIDNNYLVHVSGSIIKYPCFTQIDIWDIITVKACCKEQPKWSHLHCLSRKLAQSRFGKGLYLETYWQRLSIFISSYLKWARAERFVAR